MWDRSSANSLPFACRRAVVACCWRSNSSTSLCWLRHASTSITPIGLCGTENIDDPVEFRTMVPIAILSWINSLMQPNLFNLHIVNFLRVLLMPLRTLSTSRGGKKHSGKSPSHLIASVERHNSETQTYTSPCVLSYLCTFPLSGWSSSCCRGHRPWGSLARLPLAAAPPTPHLQPW